MIAINDAFLLETFVFQILKKHFRSEPCYLALVELFHDVRRSLSVVITIHHTVSLTTSHGRR